MFVNGLGTANPSRSYSKAECWDAFRASDWFLKLDRRARLVTETVLRKDNGIQTRSLALSGLGDAFKIDPDTLHARFLAHAPILAAEAGRKSLDEAGLSAHAIDAVVISTCTGYLCPGLSSYVIERLGLRPDVLAFDLVGQGCGAALPNMRLADALLSSGQCSQVLSVCVEVCSAAMYLDNDPGVLISACLFGDGAGAAVLSKLPSPGRRSMQWKAYGSLTNPAERDALLFQTQGGMLRNVLTRPVPRLAAEHAGQVFQTVTEGAGLRRADISQWIMHAGGRDVLIALERKLDIAADGLRHSAAMLSQFGNMSSAFVYFVLQAALREKAAGKWWWMSSFGAGFSCYGALLEVD